VVGQPKVVVGAKVNHSFPPPVKIDVDPTRLSRRDRALGFEQAVCANSVERLRNLLQE
jgi:hypothetical protein